MSVYFLTNEDKRELEQKIEEAKSSGGGSGATAEQLAQIEKNKSDIGKLSETIEELKESGTSGSEVEISETEPTNENTDLWINPVDNDEVNIYTAEETEALIDEKINEELEKLSVPSGSAEIPTFNLIEMGLPTVTPNTQVDAETDTTELIQALEKGAVKIIFNINFGEEYGGLMEITTTLFATIMDDGSEKMYVSTLYLPSEYISLVHFMFFDGMVSALYFLMG